MKQEKEKDQDQHVCDKNPEPVKVHHYSIIRGTGAVDGIPTWMCPFCKITIKSS